MTYASYVCVFLNVASAIPVVDVTLITTRKPFGVRMCEDLCTKYNCGSSFAYDVSSLTCDIYDNEKIRNVTQKAPFHTRVTDQPEKEQTYPGVLKTSSKDDINKDLGLEDRNKRTWSRLLVSPYQSPTYQKVYIYSLVDRSIRPYKHIFEKRVSCVIYIPSLKSIWMSTDRHIQSLILNRKDRQTVVKLYRSKVYSMAVDDARGLVFVSLDNFDRSKVIVKYTTKGKEICRCTVDSKIGLYITIDRNNKTVFYNTHKQIRVTDYELEDHDDVVSCKSCHVVAYDAMDKTLFYQNRIGLIMKQKSGKLNRVTQTDPKSVTFVYRDRNHILFTIKDKPIIFMLDSVKRHNKILSVKKSTKREEVYGLLICALD